MARDPAMVAQCLVTSSSIISSRAVICTGIAVSARIAVSTLGALPLGACFGGVIDHLAVGPSVRLLSSKSATYTMPTPTTTITSALRVKGDTSRGVRDFGHEGRLLFVQSNGIHDVL
jgi:hypothetical protein